VDHYGVRQAAPAPRFDRTPTSLGRPPARPGQHTREALTDWGIADVDDLLGTGAAIQD
jgi:alpha-methylacyl-CoA racemase